VPVLFQRNSSGCPTFIPAFTAASSRTERRYLILGILVTPGSSRVIRSAVIAMRHLAYVETARCLGAGHARIILWHVLPNVFVPILILATVRLGTAILAEATISFLATACRRRILRGARC